MEVEIGRGKKGRRAYGFDDIAIVPSRRTRDPDATADANYFSCLRFRITILLLPLRFPIPRLLCLGLRHELAVLRLAVPATRFVIHTTIEIYPHLTASLS